MFLNFTKPSLDGINNLTENYINDIFKQMWYLIDKTKQLLYGHESLAFMFEANRSNKEFIFELFQIVLRIKYDIENTDSSGKYFDNYIETEMKEILSSYILNKIERMISVFKDILLN